MVSTPDDPKPETQPGHAPRGPQETSPTEDPDIDVPLDEARDPGVAPAQAERVGDEQPGQMPESASLEVNG